MSSEVKLSEQSERLIAQEDDRLNTKVGYRANDIKRYVRALIDNGSVEVGWREACGKTDPTHQAYRAWLRVLKRLRADGLKITEERVKHDNAWATRCGGFWSSVKYTLVGWSVPAAVKQSLTAGTSNVGRGRLDKFEQEER